MSFIIYKKEVIYDIKMIVMNMCMMRMFLLLLLVVVLITSFTIKSTKLVILRSTLLSMSNLKDKIYLYNTLTREKVNININIIIIVNIN